MEPAGNYRVFQGLAAVPAACPPILGGDVDDVEIEELGHQALVFKEGLEPPLLHLGKFGFGADITERLPGRAARWAGCVPSAPGTRG